MCGIVGAVAERNIQKILIEGLKRLEYRGYDSAGIAIIAADESINRMRSLGKVAQLEKALATSPLQGNTGIAHTRWATHGAPSESNAHPLMSANEIALVHNGIIENHDVLRKTLLTLGYEFSSDTDTETVVHLVHYYYQQSGNFLEAVKACVSKLEGAYSLGIISAHHPDCLIAVRHGSPLVIGKGIGENFIASDPLAIMPVTQQFMYLEDQDIAVITRESIKVYANDELVNRPIKIIEANSDVIDRGEYRHYMYKEIFDQPQAIAACLEGRVIHNRIHANTFNADPALFARIKQVKIVACGTSYHAGLVARNWLEETAKIPCTVEIASEFRYRNNIVAPDTLFVCLSQSGETADTLAALRLAKKLNFLTTLAICNVAESSLIREAHHQFLTRAGAEIGVASTKAFITQLTALLILTLHLAENTLPISDMDELIHALEHLPTLVEKTLQLNQDIKDLAVHFADKHHALFLGRGNLFPIALEGALKLKEISYIHAEGYPAGELKHGPLALVDKNMPIIALAPDDNLFEKIKSNLHEVKARDGELFVFTDNPEAIESHRGVTHVIQMPTVLKIVAPIIYTIPMQLLSYHVAVLKGTDVDQPRNLAKSVTVE
jgi:glucosamine--fructose-6-phosphate aminotransferase (isomerizing)